MQILRDSDVATVDLGWRDLVGSVTKALETMSSGAFAQPSKSYLRYGNPKNRFIAMPAYLGGAFDVAGIKWIASFPDNIKRGLARAHAITILSDSDTGTPTYVVESTRLSILRAAAVSGMTLKMLERAGNCERWILQVGIVGCGPVGRAHIEMVRSLYGDRVLELYTYDVDESKAVDAAAMWPGVARPAKNWREVHIHSDTVIACTVGSRRYVDSILRPGSLHLNVSLRDYQEQCFDALPYVVIDDWVEVCREDTDVHRRYLAGKLRQHDCITLSDLPYRAGQMVESNGNVIVNPMGLAAFDIAVTKLFVDRWSSAVLGKEEVER
jgi:ornithine cyclodeaminase/alanine dehydrogenase-like protein (mu-crystallin family)